MPMPEEQWSKFINMMYWLQVAKPHFNDEDQKTIDNVIDECADVLKQLCSPEGGE